MRLFYVVYAQEKRVQDYLNILRAIANPREKEPAHLTVRGPYARPRKPLKEDYSPEGLAVTVSGADMFSGPHQNTVIFRCLAEDLRKIWYKPHYKQFNPHITIYDGDSRPFAENVLRIVSSAQSFAFHCTSLEPLKTRRGQVSLKLLSSIDYDILAALAGRPISAQDLLRLPESSRLILLRRAVEKMFAAPENSEVIGEDAPWSDLGASSEIFSKNGSHTDLQRGPADRRSAGH